MLTSCSRDAPGKHGKAWRSALRIFMGRPRMATISQDFLLPYQALSRKWQLKQATSTSVWWMDKSNMLLSVPRCCVSLLLPNSTSPKRATRNVSRISGASNSGTDSSTMKDAQVIVVFIADTKRAGKCQHVDM